MRKLILSSILLCLPVLAFAQLMNQGKPGAQPWRVKIYDVGGNAVSPPSAAQFPATLGQKTSALSTSVAVASDQAAIPTSSTQLPATLGPKTSALSTSVTMATDGGNPCINPTATLVSAGGATSAGPTVTQIVALSGSTKIYVCSLTVIGVSGTTPTFSLVQGTGSNCASNQGALVPAWTTTAGALFAFANPVAVGTAAYALCWKTTGTSPIQNYTLTYVQQ